MSRNLPYRGLLPVLALVVVFVFACADTPAPEEAPFVYPPDWAPQEAVWLGWPEPWEPPNAWMEERLAREERLRLRLIEELLSGSDVVLIVESDTAEASAREAIDAAGIATDRVRFHRAPAEDLVPRDAGPRFLTNGSSLAIADIAWDCYGFAPAISGEECQRRAGNDNSVAEAMGLPTVTSPVVSEGGALEATDRLLMGYLDAAQSRNPELSVEEIESAYLEIYGKEKMIWLQRSPRSDQAGQKVADFFGWGAAGHADEYARFTDERTVVVAQVPEAERDANELVRDDYEVLSENWDELQAATTVDGEPLRVVAMPFANPSDFAFQTPYTVVESIWPELETEFDSDAIVWWTPAVSYMNFIITNDKVIGAAYWQEGMPESVRQKDEEAARILGELFPERKIVTLNPLPLNWGGGGMHCATQQQPALPRTHSEIDP